MKQIDLRYFLLAIGLVLVIVATAREGMVYGFTIGICVYCGLLYCDIMKRI